MTIPLCHANEYKHYSLGKKEPLNDPLSYKSRRKVTRTNTDINGFEVRGLAKVI